MALENDVQSQETAEQDPIDQSKLQPIPQPPQHLFGLLGNLPDIEAGFPARSFWNLMDLYSPVFKVNLSSGKETVVVGNQQLVNEIFDENRFVKIPNRNLVELRALLGDGLFTAFKEEENWWIAHRLLVPVSTNTQPIAADYNVSRHLAHLGSARCLTEC